MENQNSNYEIEQSDREMHPPATSSRTNTYMIPLSIVIAGVLIAGAVFYSNSARPSTVSVGQGDPSQQQPTAQAADISKVKTAGQPFIGNPNAPVTIAYWYDYQCPFCKRTEQTVMPSLINDYVKTGKVKIVYKDFQFLGEDSQTAGLAERAVWEVAPDKFYQWHSAMYEKQDNENSGWGNRADILALVRSLGIDDGKVGQLMTSKAAEYQKAMDADKAEGQAFGVTGTPGTIIGKQLIEGAQPYAVFKQLIDLTLQGK